MASDKPSVTIYTDGGAEPNPGPGGWGVVLIHDATGRVKELSGGDPATTNNRMELTAAIEALNALTRPCTIVLHTDSTYVKDGITKWIHGWQAKGWKTADKKPVKNADLWQALLDASRRHRIDWQWVKGHAGHDGNERADELARQGMEPYKA